MTLGLLGKKLGMTRIYDEAGTVIPVTVIQAGPCPIVQIKNKERDGYCALQLGFDSRKESKTNRPQSGHFKKAEVGPTRILREFRVDEMGDYKAGESVNLEIFEVGDKLDVTGISKGRGFAGAQKRHGSSRGPESHGSRYHRKSGSLGASATPARVFKLKKTPGHMGAERVTVQNLVVMKLDKENNLIVVRGSIPGCNNGYLMLRKSIKTRS